MEREIGINATTCTRCGRCVRVCPAGLFKSETGAIEVTAQGCIACGHCVAACESGSVGHSDFPAESIHPINYAQMPTPEQVALLTRVRRSNRAFLRQAVPMELLDQIVEAAHRAPTASNLQQVEFTLITDPEKLNRVIDYTIGVFSRLLNLLENPFVKPILKRVKPALYGYVPHFRSMQTKRAQGGDPILRGATAVLFIHTPSGSRFGALDANLAYQNASLMAESLGVSQVYTGFVYTATVQDKKNTLARELGINGTIHAGMALGMPAFRFPNYVDKKAVAVHKL